MNVLRIENNYSWLLTNDSEIKHTLWNSLRVRERNYYHSPLYKQKKWDGYVDFFKKDSGKFLTGLLPEVRLALKHLGARYETQDLRSSFDFTCDRVDENWLSPLVLRDYQVDYI